MSITCNRLNRKLNRMFNGRVSAREENGCLVLSGSLERWSDVVRAGQMSVRPRRYAGLVNDIVCTLEPCPPMRVPPFSDLALDGATPDVLIVGGGVVGCAIARELSKKKLHVLLVDKERDVALHASSRNDGMIHPGIDLLPGQVKRAYDLRGNRMYDALCKELDVPFSRCGQYLCFRDAWIVPLVFLAQFYYRLLGLSCRFISKSELHLREPHLSHALRCALFFKDAGVVSPYLLTVALAENAIDNGVQVSLDTAVLDMETRNGRILSVQTNRGTVHPRLVVNAAGVFSDDVASMAGDRFFSIHPRRGTNSILDQKAASQLNTIASSYGTVATKSRHSKGGGLVRTIDGNLLCGPDAEEIAAKEEFSTNAESIRRTFDKQRLTSPSLSERDIITYFTGVRAATYEEDFVICKGRSAKNIVHAAGIQSPGLTAAPAIAEDVSRMVEELLGAESPVLPNPSFEPRRTGIVCVKDLPNAERDALIRRDPDYGEIVCRCEQISRGEIRDALRRSLPCDTVDGVKRRVRPGMGRCQGGFCGPLVLRMIAEEKGMPLDEVCKSGLGSNLLFGEDKA